MSMMDDTHKLILTDKYDDKIVLDHNPDNLNGYIMVRLSHTDHQDGAEVSLTRAQCTELGLALLEFGDT